VKEGVDFLTTPLSARYDLKKWLRRTEVDAGVAAVGALLFSDRVAAAKWLERSSLAGEVADYLAAKKKRGSKL